MTKQEFMEHVTDRYEVLPASTGTVPALEILYSTHENHEWYAIVNGELVDVSAHDWDDFDGFVEAVHEEYKKIK